MKEYCIMGKMREDRKDIHKAKENIHKAEGKYS